MDRTDRTSRRRVLAAIGAGLAGTAGAIGAASAATDRGDARAQSSELGSVAVDGSSLVVEASGESIETVDLYGPYGQRVASEPIGSAETGATFDLLTEDGAGDGFAGYDPGTHRVVAYTDDEERAAESSVPIEPRLELVSVTPTDDDRQLAVTLRNVGTGPTAVERVSYPVGPFDRVDDEYTTTPRTYDLSAGLVPAGATATVSTKPFELSTAYETRAVGECGTDKVVASGVTIALTHAALGGTDEPSLAFDLAFGGERTTVDSNIDRDLYVCTETAVEDVDVRG